MIYFLFLSSIIQLITFPEKQITNTNLNMSSATVASSSASKHESFHHHMDEFNEGLHEFNEKFMKFSKDINQSLHKGADKTSHKVSYCTKKMFKHKK